MNTKKVKYYLFIFLVFFTSCQDFLDVNDDPNALQSSNEELLLPYGIASLCYVIGDRYQVLGALWSQHWTQSLGASQYKGIDSYDLSSSSFEGEFSELYAGALMNFEEIKNMSSQNGKWNYYLIATVLQCYTFQVLADLYEYIPFSKAFKGNEGNLTPEYEYSRNIYDSLIVRIDKALEKDYDNEELDEIGDADLLFGGDMDRWVEFANTLKLKIFLRQSDVRPEVARQGIEKLYEDDEDGNFLDYDAVMTQFSNETNKRNPLYETEIIFFGYNPNLVLSNTLLSFMEKNGDYDRLDAMFDTPESGGEHKGLNQGNYNDPDEPAGTNSSDYSKPVFYPTYPIFLMSMPEIYLLQAEAIIRFGTGDYDDAREMYENGVEVAFSRYGIDDAELYYKSGGPYAFPSEGSDPEIFIEAIIMQKWVALVNFQSLETFFDHNRTMYPKEADENWDNFETENDTVKFTVSVNNVTSGRYPRRLLFPESEYSTNPNTPEQKNIYDKLWWHKQ